MKDVKKDVEESKKKMSLLRKCLMGGVSSLRFVSKRELEAREKLGEEVRLCDNGEKIKKMLLSYNIVREDAEKLVDVSGELGDEVKKEFRSLRKSSFLWRKVSRCLSLDPLKGNLYFFFWHGFFLYVDRIRDLYRTILVLRSPEGQKVLDEWVHGVFNERKFKSRRGDMLPRERTISHYSLRKVLRRNRRRVLEKKMEVIPRSEKEVYETSFFPKRPKVKGGVYCKGLMEFFNSLRGKIQGGVVNYHKEGNSSTYSPNFKYEKKIEGKDRIFGDKILALVKKRKLEEKEKKLEKSLRQLERRLGNATYPEYDSGDRFELGRVGELRFKYRDVDNQSKSGERLGQVVGDGFDRGVRYRYKRRIKLCEICKISNKKEMLKTWRDYVWRRVSFKILEHGVEFEIAEMKELGFDDMEIRKLVMDKYEDEMKEKLAEMKELGLNEMAKKFEKDGRKMKKNLAFKLGKRVGHKEDKLKSKLSDVLKVR